MTTKQDQARRLAALHYGLDTAINSIYRILTSHEVEDQPTEPIKLLEVNADTIPSGILPIGFGPVPASGITYPSTVVEVTPAEFDQLKAGNLPLPTGWQLGELLPRAAGN